MANIQNLPDEILMLIFKELKYFDLYNLSNTCKRFERFYEEPFLSRKTILDHGSSIPIMWPVIHSFFNKRKNYIVHLDISYIHWLPRTKLLKSIDKLKFLKFLNVIETGIFLSHLKPLKLSLQSLCITYSQNKDQNKRLDVSELHLFLRSDQLNNLLYHYIKALQLPTKEMCMKIELCNGIEDFKIFFIKYWQCILEMSFRRIIIVNTSPMFWNERLTQGNLSITLNIFTKYKSYHKVFIETHQGIHMSDNLCTDVEDTNLVKHYVPSIFQLKQCYNNEIFLLYAIQNYEMENNLLDQYAYKRINSRMNEECVLQRSEYYFKRHIPIVQHFTQKDHSLKRLIIDECYINIVDKPQTTRSEEPLFKKPRVSRITTSTIKNIFEEIIESNPEIECCKIQTSPPSSLSPPEWEKFTNILDTSSLWNITSLKCLKHLSLTEIPNNYVQFFQQVFQNCHNLEFISISPKHGFHYAESLTNLLHLNKSIKVVRLNCKIRNMNIILENISKCSSLKVIDIFARSEILDKKQIISVNTLLNMIKLCVKLVSINIEQQNLTKSQISEYRKFEKIIASKCNHIFINLTRHITYSFFKKESFDLDRCFT